MNVHPRDYRGAVPAILDAEAFSAGVIAIRRKSDRPRADNLRRLKARAEVQFSIGITCTPSVPPETAAWLRRAASDSHLSQ